MAAATLDVVGIGNAIVDVLAHADDGFLDRHGLAKGTMTLIDAARANAPFRKAAELAHGAGRRVSLSLSDPFCVGRHRAEFRELVAHHVDILFANEAEICSLYETEDFDEAARRVRVHCDVAALTRSE